MEITRGIIRKAQKVLIYGPEGIGKTSFASRFPDPVFIDTEGGSASLDVARLPKPTSWAMLIEEVAYIRQNPALCKTLVIDTMDWAEALCVEAVCAKYQKKGIEDFGYGNGYVYTKEELGRLLNSLQEIIDLGINVVLTAHAQMRKFEQPDELGAYDRWELKLGKKTSSQTAPLVKEWADMVLFANYETIVVTTDGKKNKAQGSKRVMYTEHHACWDAKNRAGLAPKLPFDYNEIAAVIEGNAAQIPVQSQIQTQSQVPVQTAAAAPVQTPPLAQTQADPLDELTEAVAEENSAVSPEHKKLADLMAANNISAEEIRAIVAKKGYYPFETPLENYDPAFVGGVLVGAWDQVYSAILANLSR